MKKVLFVIQSLSNGGAEKSLVNLLNEMPKEKYEIDILLFRNEGMFLNQVPSWVNILETPYILEKLYSPIKNAKKLMFKKLFSTLISRTIKKNPFTSLAFRWKNFYCRYINSIDKEYDVAIAYVAGEVLYYVIDKVHARKKYVWVHTDYLAAKYPKEYDYFYFDKVDGIVSVSDKCINVLKSVFPNFKDKIYNIANITSSVAINEKSKEYIPNEYDKDSFIIVSVGRLDPVKGFDMAIKAASILKKRGFNFKWYVIGSGNIEKILKEMIVSENVELYFHLLGSRENPYPYILNSNLVVQTSRFEGKSVVLDEAKIIGIPIVSTNYSTVKDQLKDMAEGLIVEMTPVGIANGIIRIMTDETLYKDIKEYLKKHEYGNQDEINKYIDIIDL